MPGEDREQIRNVSGQPQALACVIWRPRRAGIFAIINYGINEQLPFSPGAGRLRRVPEARSRLLPGVPGRLPGLHRPLPLLQIPPRLRHLGTLPQGSQEALPGREHRQLIPDLTALALYGVTLILLNPKHGKGKDQVDLQVGEGPHIEFKGRSGAVGALRVASSVENR